MDSRLFFPFLLTFECPLSQAQILKSSYGGDSSSNAAMQQCSSNAAAAAAAAAAGGGRVKSGYVILRVVLRTT
jgi:hypothetical protein